MKYTWAAAVSTAQNAVKVCCVQKKLNSSIGNTNLSQITNQMDKYKTISTRLGWIGIWQTSLNYKNTFMIWWGFLRESNFGLSILQVKGRCLFGFSFQTCVKSKGCYLTFSLLYLPAIAFRIGNGRSWLYIRNENLYAYICSRKNRTLPF